MVDLKKYKPRQWARLGRPHDLRMALLKSMVTQLIQHERICTTLPKAEALKRYADKVVTLAKQGTPQAYDKAAGIIRTDAELHKLFTTLALRYHHRQGGYTRVIPAGLRQFDATPMAYIEFVDREGEIRPASRPAAASPLLPLAARTFLEQQTRPDR